MKDRLIVAAAITLIIQFCDRIIGVSTTAKEWGIDLKAIKDIVFLGVFLAIFIQAVRTGEVGEKEILQLIWPDSPNATPRPQMPAKHVKLWVRVLFIIITFGVLLGLSRWLFW